jgi:hypothetical protein
MPRHTRATIRRWSASGPAAGQSYDDWRLSGPHDDDDDDGCDCGPPWSECTCDLAFEPGDWMESEE